jgi:alpha-beta hydrolase superfamily lysophospholipase
MSTSLTTDFTYKTIELKDDYEGKATATLIAAKSNTGKRKSILYLHGFIDYFFHPHVAKQFDEHGYDFHALDLRKYGRSLMKHQRACYCKSVDEYFEEITIAIQEINAKGNDSVILLGHSTGGLTASLYANYGAEKKLVSGVILNSPFFEMNLPNTTRSVLKVLSNTIPLINPYAKLSNAIPAAYGKSLHKDYNGEWDYNLEWKPLKGFPAYFMWFKAVMSGHKKLQNNSNITVPVLVMHSSQSLPKKWKKEDFQKSDIVLNVKHIKEIGAKLGKQITVLEVKDGLHDIFLSREDVRNFAFTEMFKWLQSTVNKTK